MTDAIATEAPSDASLQVGDTVVQGRFRCDRVVKSGHGVQTCVGTDLLLDAPVVIKRAASAEVADAMRARLEHEADVLKLIGGASGLSPVVVAREGGAFSLVRPFVAGITLEERLRGGSLSVASALRVGIDVLSALQQAHDHQVLHRDVKPANVVVDEAEPLARAVLIDFGFARSTTLDASLGQERVGTARYLAPEAAGLLVSAVDERSDLYSVGVVLFECLAGRPLFDGSDVGVVLQQHLSTPAPELRELGVDLPRVLDAVVQRLLRKDPAERYQSAYAALADLAAIADAVGRGIKEPSVVIGLHDRRQVLTEPAFVGRLAELSLLGGFIRQAREGAGGLVLLEAESGGGKSRLLDELAQQSRQTAWILRGQGVDQAAQRPFQLLEGVVDGIVAACDDGPEVEARLRSQVGDRADAVAASLPGLTQVLGRGSAADLGPEAYGETRSITALSALLDALGSLARPPVVLLDDCQWADGPTLRLLAHWQHRVAERGSPVVVIAAFRSEEVPAGHPLRTVDPIATVALAAFGDGDIRSLAESMAGPLPDEGIRTIASLSEGSPFMASAVLRGLVEAGALVDSPGGWQVDRERLADVQTSRRAALFLLRRLELLAPATLDLLSVGAVLGKEFDLRLAVELCGQTPEVAAAALAEAGRRHIVWVDGAAGRARLLHDKLREALLSRLDGEHRRGLHLRAAGVIEALDRDRVFELAYHFDAAGEGERALPYALQAAELARAQYSLDVADAHYRMAWRAVEAGDDIATKARVAEALGDVLTLEGSYEEAAAQLELALSLATGDLDRASLQGRLGDVAFKRGDQRSARTHLEGAIRQLGRRLPHGNIAFFLAVLVEVFVQAAHTLAPRLFLGRRSREGADREFLAIRLYSRLAYVYWFSAGKVPCAWAHLREMNLVERYPPSPELAQAYSEHAPVMTMAPWFSRGITYAKRSLDIRRDLGDLWGQGQSLSFYGVVLYAASRYRESIEKCQEAVRLLDQTGDRWEANTATWHIAFAHYRLGELATAVEVSRALHRSAVDIGDAAAAGISLSGWSRASGGRVPAELIQVQLEQQQDDAHTAAEVHVAEGVRLLAAASWDDAVATLEEAARIVKRAGLRQEYVAPVGPWLATALRSQSEALSLYEAGRRRAILKRAAREARRGWRIARHYRNNAPHALRERGLLLGLEGKHLQARRLLALSLSIAERQEARYEHALTRQAWGKMGFRLGSADAAGVRAAAEDDLAAMLPAPPQSGARVPSTSLSLADRFATLLATGRRIASAPSPEEVFVAVRAAAVTLLRGEKCDILDVADAGGEMAATASAATASTNRVDRLSRSLISQALSAGKPVILADDVLSDSADSIVLSGLRSALCAPIYCEGIAVACLYVTHSHVGGLFGEDEIQLTEFVTALAGAALEHVAGTEARFRSLAQNSSDVITIVDRDATVVYQSSAVTRVFGFQPTAMTGRPLAEWLHPDDAADLLGTIDRVMHSGQASLLVECRLRHQDGSWRDVETALTNLVDDPSVNGIVLNSRDISDRKRAERELRETLEREHQMRERLQELDRIKTDFLSSVSHELRTPLTSILGYVEILGDGCGGTLALEQSRVLSIVERNAQRLLILIEELLIMSKVESGSFTLSVGPVAIGELLEGAYQAVMPDLNARALDVVIDVAPDADVIEGDGGQLDRVMINLLTNAIKFTPDGGRVSVSATRQEDCLVLRVKDTGIGIPIEDQDRIFERFFRSSSTQHLAVRGTGLGLSITKAIIEEHGGTIAVSSSPGEGTEVMVTLPVHGRAPGEARPRTGGLTEAMST